MIDVILLSSSTVFSKYIAEYPWNLHFTAVIILFRNPKNLDFY